MSSKQRIHFGIKRLNRPRNNFKSKPKEFLDDEDEQYTDFSQQNKKKTRE